MERPEARMEPGRQSHFISPRDSGEFSLRWTDGLAWVVTGLVVFALSVVFNGWGLVHFEWEQYIGYHLGPGSIWEKIFDSRNLDQNTYTGRELSYLVDHLDVWFVALSVHWGWPVFISLTHGLLGTFLGVWIAWFVARDLRLGSLVGLLAALLLWTGPCFYLHFLTRSAKMLTAVALVVLVVEIRRALQATTWLRGRFIFSIAAAAVVLALADRQGFYFLLCAVAVMLLQWSRDRAPRSGAILGLLGVVVAFELVYFFKIAPALTRAFFAYDPDFSLNRLPMEKFTAQPGEVVADGFRLLGRTLGDAAGGLSIWMIVLLGSLTVGAVVARDVRTRAWRHGIPQAALVIAGLAAMGVMYVLMTLRHPPLLWRDVGLTYYGIPTAALAVLGFVWCSESWASSPGRRWALAALLLGGIAGNIAHLPEYSRIIATGHLHDSIVLSEGIRDALMQRDNSRQRVPDDVWRVSAYQALAKYAPERLVSPPAWDEPLYGEFYRTTRGDASPLQFIGRFGGNADSRFLNTSGRFFRLTDGREFIGGTAGVVEMRLSLPANRVRGELVVRRTGGSKDQPVAADFAIYARHYRGDRYERWRGRVELAPGEQEKVVPYAIDSSHLPSMYTVEIPKQFEGRLVAGWRNPEITDVGSDAPAPAWLVPSSPPAQRLDEDAFQALLPGSAWRPEEAHMRGGRITANGIELQAGGEIWLHVHGLVSHLAGLASAVPAKDDRHPAAIRGLWYKAGRLQGYAAPSSPADLKAPRTFQAWCAEPGGWIVIFAHLDPGAAPVLIQITEVTQEK